MVCDALLCPKCKSGPLQVKTSQQSIREDVYNCLDCSCFILSEQLDACIKVSVKFFPVDHDTWINFSRDNQISRAEKNRR